MIQPRPLPVAESEAEPAGELRWSVLLARQRPAHATVVVAAAVGSGLLAGWLFQSAGAGLLVAFVLIAALSDFLFPNRYRLSAEGAEARTILGMRRIAWTDVRRVYLLEDEIKLSPLPPGSRREPFRGVLLRCAGNRDEVLAAVRRYRDAAAADRAE